MPWPIEAAWMSIHKFKKPEIRAINLAFFVFAHGENVVLHLFVNSFDSDVIWLKIILCLPLVRGILKENLPM